MTEYVILIHGAWHGGWCWDEVKENLEANGLHVTAPTMPGHENGDDRSEIQLSDYIDRIGPGP